MFLILSIHFQVKWGNRETPTLSFIGAKCISKSIFGTATMDDLKAAVERVDQIKRLDSNITTTLQSYFDIFKHSRPLEMKATIIWYHKQDNRKPESDQEICQNTTRWTGENIYTVCVGKCVFHSHIGRRNSDHRIRRTNNALFIWKSFNYGMWLLPDEGSFGLPH